MLKRDKLFYVPKFLRRGEITCRAIAERASVKGRKNTSKFFSDLYSEVFLGTPNNHHLEDVDLIINGVERRFRPDIVRDSSEGKKYTETKASKWGDNRPLCGLWQIENYSALLFERLSCGDFLPEVDYAFFRYGDSSLNRFTTDSPRKLVSGITRGNPQLTIMPINLVYFLLGSSRLKIMNQETSKGPDSQTYFSPYSSLLNGFHLGEVDLEKLSSRFKEPSLLEDLMLDSLKVERGHTPEILVSYYGVKKMNPISVTRYHLDFDCQKEWLDLFYENHERIFEGMGFLDIPSILKRQKEEVKKIEEYRKEVKKHEEERVRRLEEENEDIPF